jgi:hypothetical protein
MPSKLETTVLKSNSTDKAGWLKKGGILVFLFFLFKGIGWLVLFGLVAFGVMDETNMGKLKDFFSF